MNQAVLLARGLILLWSGWLSIVFASNLADGLKTAGWLPSSWLFASGNLSLVHATIEFYSLSMTFAVVLFAGVVLVQLAGSVLLWRAFLDPEAVVARGRPKVIQAFCLPIGLFATFLLVDELFIVYDRLPAIETTHLLVLCALLLSVVAITVLGESASRGGAA